MEEFFKKSFKKELKYPYDGFKAPEEETEAQKAVDKENLYLLSEERFNNELKPLGWEYKRFQYLSDDIKNTIFEKKIRYTDQIVDILRDMENTHKQIESYKNQLEKKDSDDTFDRFAYTSIYEIEEFIKYEHLNPERKTFEEIISNPELRRNLMMHVMKALKNEEHVLEEIRTGRGTQNYKGPGYEYPDDYYTHDPDSEENHLPVDDETQ